MRLADRVAVLGQGGVLQQYTDPATLLGAPTNDFVADFVGSDRGLKRLAVTPISDEDLQHVPVVAWDDSLADARAALQGRRERWAVVLADGALRGWIGVDRASGDGQVRDHAVRVDAWVPRTATLKRAFSTMLSQDAGWVAVLDGETYLGVLTPASLHAALRRSVGEGRDQRAVGRPALSRGRAIQPSGPRR